MRRHATCIWWNVGNLRHNLRYALRVLLKSRGFTVIAAVTLALGIGANTAIFSVIHGVLLQPLPYPHADRLISIAGKDVNTGTLFTISLTRFETIEAQTKTLENVGAYLGTAVSLTTSGEPEQVAAIHVSAGLFPTLGAGFSAGRGFTAEEDRVGGPDVAVITDSFWHNHFGGDPATIGKTIPVDGKPTLIVGILAPAFRFPFQQPEPLIWMPRVFDGTTFGMERIRSGAAFLFALGRMRPGVSLSQVGAELDTISDRYKRELAGMADAPRFTVAVNKLEDALVGGARPSLLVLMGAVGLVLLIACVNVASLVMARASSRHKEFSIRAALGASRGQLAAQLLTESVVLAIIGGALGTALAWWTLPLLLRAVGPGALPRADEIAISGVVLLFSLATCCATGVAFGLVPALQTARRDPQDGLKESGRGSTAGARGRRAREWMVVAEVALALFLMTGAGLLLRGFAGLLYTNPGFSTAKVLTIPVVLPESRFPKPAQKAELYRQLLEAIRTIPGVESAGAISHLPLTGNIRQVYVCPEGTLCQGLGKDPAMPLRQVDTQFFDSLRIPLAAGRAFNDHDIAGAPPVTIVNSVVAERYFPNQNPIGRHIKLSREGIQLEIAGVIREIKFNRLNDPPAEEFYIPQMQIPWANFTLTVRSSMAPEALAAAIRRKALEIDRNLPLGSMQTMDEVLGASIAQPRLIAEMVGGFAGFALILASVGIYGVVAFHAAQRRQEMAIRVALGADSGDVLKLVVGQGMRLVAIGLAVGLAGSLGISRLLSALTLTSAGIDAVTIGAVCVVLLAVAMAACFVPARRAAKVDAMIALRSE